MNFRNNPIEEGSYFSFIHTPIFPETKIQKERLEEYFRYFSFYQRENNLPEKIELYHSVVARSILIGVTEYSKLISYKDWIPYIQTQSMGIIPEEVKIKPIPRGIIKIEFIKDKYFCQMDIEEFQNLFFTDYTEFLKGNPIGKTYTFQFITQHIYFCMYAVFPNNEIYLNYLFTEREFPIDFSVYERASGQKILN